MDRRNFIRLATWWLAVSNIVPQLQAKDDPLTVPIRREAVESSSIASIGFNAELQVLEIEFRSGALYRYLAVPPAVFDGLQKAESKGRYFTQNIRGHFEYRRLPDMKP